MQPFPRNLFRQNGQQVNILFLCIDYEQISLGKEGNGLRPVIHDCRSFEYL